MKLTFGTFVIALVAAFAMVHFTDANGADPSREANAGQAVIEAWAAGVASACAPRRRVRPA